MVTLFIKSRVSEFDKDRGVQDGIVDGVIIIFPGQGKNTTRTGSTHPGYLHPCCWGGKVTSDGVSYATQLIVPELWENGSTMILNGFGVYVHEMSHMLGLPDFYDTNYKGSGMDYWSLMDAGEYVNVGFNPTPYTAYEKIYMDWIQPVELNQPASVQNLTNVSDGGNAYIIYNDANHSEYYLLENLNSNNNVVYGTMQNFFGGGLIIYHVDEDANAWNNNKINTIVDHQRMTIVPANGHFEIQDNFTKGSNPDVNKLASELIGHLWRLHRLVLECGDLARAERRVDCFAAVALPEVQFADQVVPEHTDPLVACAAREMRQLQGADFAAVHLRRGARRLPLPCGVFPIHLCPFFRVGVLDADGGFSARGVDMDISHDRWVVYRL